MKLSTLSYLFKEGIVSLWKNRTMALASAGTIILCLMILGVSYIMGVNIDYGIEQIEKNFGTIIYINESVSESDILELQSRIEKIDNVAEVKYVSKEEALEVFTSNNGDETLFDMFKEDNPLPASFEVTCIDIKNQKEFVKEVLEFEGVDEVKYLESEMEEIIKIRETVSSVCYIIIICLVIVGLLLMSNTIKLTVLIRRKEINIMKYVGATDAFIRVPFLIEGIIIGLIGAFVSMTIVWFGYESIVSLTTADNWILGEIMMVPLVDVMSVLTPLYVLLGAGIGTMGSAMAIRRHLRV